MTDTLVNSISSKAFRDAVQYLGWKPSNDYDTEKFYVFANPNFPKRQLRVPISESAPDYDDAVNIALTKLAEMTHLSSEMLRDRIYRTTEDMISYRTLQPNSDAIPFSFALAIMNSAKDLLLTAAHSVVKPQLYHQRLNRAEPLELLRKTNFRHTQTGSFILNVSTPLSAVETDVSPDPYLFETPSMVRQTTRLIYNSLDRLLDAIETNTVEKTLAENKEQPLLSANFCKALLGLQDDDVQSDVEILIDWAAANPEPRTPKPLRIQKKHFPIIEFISKDLAPSQISSVPKLYIGTVERLDGYDIQNGLREGDVILSLIDLEEGKPIKVKVTLNVEHYAIATTAHNPTQFVILEGIMRDGRQQRRLTDISLFELVHKQRAFQSSASESK
jgi:hypothetical protein